jgi:iron(III) transport system permease protein
LTLQLMAAALSIAGVVGIVGAWAASSLETGGQFPRWIARFFLAAMVVAIAIPLILHAAAWEATAGKFGWMIMTQTGSRADGTGSFGFFTGLVACAWIHGLFGAAIVALATWFAVRQTPAEVIQQSRLEIGPLATWWRIRLPLAAPWLAASLLATAMLVATEMTVVDLYGYRTLADEFYLVYAIDPSWTEVLMTCFVPLGLAAAALSWLLISRRRFLAIQQDRSIAGTEQEQLPGRWLMLAAVLAMGIAGLITLIPVGGLLVKIGHEVVVVDNKLQASWSASACWKRIVSAPPTFGDEYFWTALIGIVTGLIAIVIAWPLAAAGRTNRRCEWFSDVVSILLFTIPGPIVGLAVVSLFQQPLPGFRMLYHQSILPTVMALLVRAVPVAYWILRSGYRGIDTPLLEAAKLEVTWLRRMIWIDFPLLKSTLLAAGLAAMVVASGDVPATLPVIPAGVATVGTRLFQLLHSGARYQEAALAIWYVTAVVMIALICWRQRSLAHVKVQA